MATHKNAPLTPKVEEGHGAERSRGWSDLKATAALNST